MKQNNAFLYRLSQFVSLLLGMRIFILVFFGFTLYVSTYFLFNQEENLRRFVFDFKVHGIILCAMLSIAAGGIMNQFYDLEKDRIQRPFRTRLQSFLKQKYFLYSYIVLNTFSLLLAFMLSPRIFIFFLIYQFFIWFYSHKISKILILNNLTYVSLTLYPFFGMLVYYQHFSEKLFLMAAFLFLLLLIIDQIKDILTIRPDRIFGYHTLPSVAGLKVSVAVIAVLFVLNAFVACLVVMVVSHYATLSFYFSVSAILLILSLYPVLFFKIKKMVWLMNLWRIWIFVGVIFMLAHGIFEKNYS